MKKETVYTFTKWVLAQSSDDAGLEDLRQDLKTNLDLADAEKGHNGLSVLQLCCILGKHFGNPPLSNFGKMVKKRFDSSRFVNSALDGGALEE